MKASRCIQAALVLMFASILIVNGPSKGGSLNRLLADNSTCANGSYYYDTRPDLYRNRYKPFFRNRPTPVVVYKIEAKITVKQSSKEKVTDISVDGNRISQTSPSKKETYIYLIGSGNHTIRWTLTTKDGKKQQFSKSFNVDASAKSIKLIIDGDKLRQK